MSKDLSMFTGKKNKVLLMHLRYDSNDSVKDYDSNDDRLKYPNVTHVMLFCGGGSQNAI